MSLILLIALVVGMPCIATLLFGVYLDHVRSQRRRRANERHLAGAKQLLLRHNALRPIGGSYRNCEGPR